MWRLRLGLPAAFALLLLSPSSAAGARPFDAGCPLPFVGEHHAIDNTCPNHHGDVPDPPVEPNDAAHALQNLAKNNLCATGTPALVTFFSFGQLQKKLDQQIPAALHWDRDHLPADRSGFKSLYTTSEGPTIGEGSVVRLAAWILKSKKAGKESVNCQISDKK